MTDAEMFGAFGGFERNEYGVPKLDDPFAGDSQSSRDLYFRFLWLQGVTDRPTQERMWNEKVARNVAAGPV